MNGDDRPMGTGTQPETSEPSSEHSIYLYGIGRSRHLSEAGDNLNRDDELHWITVGEIAAAIRLVPSREFSDDSIESRLEDYDWLIESALKHQEMVSQIHQRISVLPAKFGTIYSTEHAVRGALESSYDRLVERLDAIDGCDEWALHLFGHPDALRDVALAEDTELKQLQSELEAASPGRAYLLRQRIDDRLDAAVDELNDRLVRRVFEALGGYVREYEFDAPNAELTTEDGEPELARASVLVHRDRAEEFLSSINALASSMTGIRLEATGPWPPYTFTRIEGDE